MPESSSKQQHSHQSLQIPAGMTREQREVYGKPYYPRENQSGSLALPSSTSRSTDPDVTARLADLARQRTHFATLGPNHLGHVFPHFEEYQQRAGGDTREHAPQHYHHSSSSNK